MHFSAFTRDQFENVVKQGFVIIKNVAFISLAFTALKSLYTHITEGFSVWAKISSAISILLYSAIAVLLFMASTVSEIIL